MEWKYAARHQWVIRFGIFVGTYCLYHKETEVKSQKNELLGIYCVLIRACRKYFIIYVNPFLNRKFYVYCYEQKY